jgi:hypothetical protein
LSAPQVKIVSLPDVHLLLVSTEKLAYLEPELPSLITFYNGTHIILNHDFNVTCMCEYMCAKFSRHIFMNILNVRILHFSLHNKTEIFSGFITTAAAAAAAATTTTTTKNK